MSLMISFSFGLAVVLSLAVSILLNVWLLIKLWRASSIPHLGRRANRKSLLSR
jgi:hypothetical protein